MKQLILLLIIIYAISKHEDKSLLKHQANSCLILGLAIKVLHYLSLNMIDNVASCLINAILGFIWIHLIIAFFEFEKFQKERWTIN